MKKHSLGILDLFILIVDSHLLINLEHLLSYELKKSFIEHRETETDSG